MNREQLVRVHQALKQAHDLIDDKAGDDPREMVVMAQLYDSMAAIEAEIGQGPFQAKGRGPGW